MSRLALVNVALLVAFLALAAANLLLGDDPARRNVELLPNMVHSVAYDAFAPNPVFADGKTLQRPPEGTIPRGLMPLHYGTGKEEAARAGRELVNPLVAPADLPPFEPPAGPHPVNPADPDTVAARQAYDDARSRAAASLARGEKVFNVYCRVCHGDAGAGDGPVAKRGFPAPPSMMAERGMTMADGEIFHLITYGGENMPPYATQVSREDRWRAILFVRELQRRAPAAAPAEPPPGEAPDPVAPATAPQEVTAP